MLELFFVTLPLESMNYTLNIRGELMDLSTPQVMGIINVTPDSFYAASRVQTADEVAQRVRQLRAEGATMADIGGCSTRPGSAPVSEQEEMARLRAALPVVRREWPECVVSVDTFRPDVARMAVEELGADIINDVGSADADPTAMIRMVSRLRVPYVLMASEADLRSTLLFFADRVQRLRDYGQKDIILDPGFGFGKTLDENYRLLASLDKLQVMELPLLVGVSRKSMIHRLLDITPDEALNGTTVLHTVALMKGASILRAHDVKAAVECCKLCAKVS